jgi:hypothetical protein
MKHIIAFISLVCWLTTSVFSQVVIQQSDMPVAGDTLRVSVTNIVPAGYAKTAMDTTWNYAALEALSQRVDTFFSATATPLAYQFFFVLQGGANLASPRSGSPIPGLPVSQGFTFFKNSTTSYSDLGFAYTIQGLPLPAKYDIPDKLYQFPMTPGLSWSSTSSFSIDVPDLASYSTQRDRSSMVDGWGTIVTPFGTFQALRVKSTLAVHDSIYIDSLGIGFPFNRNIIEYKWMAQGKGIPVLQINEEGALVTATYRDIPRMSAAPLTVSLGQDTAVLKGTILDIFATITGGTPPYQVLWNPMNNGNPITVTVQSDLTCTVIVVDALQNFASDQKIVSIRYPPGIEENSSTHIQIFPNPTNGVVQLTSPEMRDNVLLEVLTPQGKIVWTGMVSPVNHEISIDLSVLPEGLYFIHLTTPGKTSTAKLHILH